MVLKVEMVKVAQIWIMFEVDPAVGVGLVKCNKIQTQWPPYCRAMVISSSRERKAGREQKWRRGLCIEPAIEPAEFNNFRPGIGIGTMGLS